MEIRKNLFIENTIKTNKRVAKLVIYANVAGPLMLLGSWLHFFLIEYYEAFEVFGYTLVMSTFLWWLNKHEKWYEFTKFASLILMEIFIGRMSMNATIGIYISLGFMPIVSCLYVDELLTLFMNLYCYLVLAVSLYFRAIDFIATYGSRRYTVHQWYMNYLLGFTIEFLFVYAITKSIVKYEKDLMKNIEIQTRKQYEAEQLGEMRMSFFSKISHELRTPLNAICGLSEILMEKQCEGDEHEYVETIYSSGKTMLTMINSILDISKMNSDQLQIKEEEYQIGNVLRDSVRIASFSVLQKDVSLITQIDTKLPEVFYGDATGISRILVNLLNNALKFTQKGTIILGISWKKEDETKGILHIMVKDTGVGIRTEEIESIFDDYIQGSAQNRDMGTGLGLTVCRNYVEAMNGKIWVESEYGKGSTFYVEVPQMVSEEKNEKIVMEHLQDKIFEPSFIAPEANILLVDDNKTNVQVALELMKKYRCKITPCLSGEKAIALLKKKDFDLIFMDHLMPEMDGIETTKKIRENVDTLYCDIPIIALSANLVGDMDKVFIKSGMNDVLGKPINREKLDYILHRWLPKNKCISVMGEADHGKSISTEI